MLAAAIRRISITTSWNIFPFLPFLLGLLGSYLSRTSMVAAFDCVEAELRCQRDSNCLLAMEAHRVTCGPLGTSCTSANLDLCHSALVGLQLSSAFNGSCWCHESSMETRTFRRCLDTHLKIFYHPCIATINSRIDGRRRQMEIDQDRRRVEEDEQRRRNDQWRNYWHQQQHQNRLVSTAASTSTSTTTTSSSTTQSRLEIEEAHRRREQQRIDYERRVQIEERHREREEAYQRRRQQQEAEEERRRRLGLGGGGITDRSSSSEQPTSPRPPPPSPFWSTRGGTTSSTSGAARTTSTTLGGSTRDRLVATTESTRHSPASLYTRSAPSVEGARGGRPETPTPYAFTAETGYAYSRSDDEGGSSTSGESFVESTPITPRHRIRHYQEKLETIGRAGEHSESDLIDAEQEGISRRHRPSSVATGETINGHSVSDFSNLFSPSHLDRLDGGGGGAAGGGEQRPRPKLSVPGEYHWSCTKSLERCLDHVACTHLLELYREKCRVDNQRCVSTDWKSCKEAYEGIRWTGLNNCTCSDDHRLHGPSCHFVELLTAHNQCIDEFKRAGYITDDNGHPFNAGQPSGTGPSPSMNNRNNKRPDLNGGDGSSQQPIGRNQTTARPSSGGGTDAQGRPLPTPTKLIPTRKPSSSSTSNITRGTTAKPASSRPSSTTTTTRPAAVVTPRTSVRSTTTSPKKQPPPIGKIPGGSPTPSTRPSQSSRPDSKLPGGKPGDKTDDDLDEELVDGTEEPSETVERPQIFLPPQRPAQPVIRLPEITWDEWEKQRLTIPAALPQSAAYKYTSNREVGLGNMTYRVESTCQMAFSHCHWDDTCSWQLSEIKSYCVTVCDKQKCAAAIGRFYKFVTTDFQEGLTFCTCRSHDVECLEYQSLLFPTCLRQMQRHEWRECGDLRMECRNDERCWPWADKYFKACNWEPVNGKCVNPHECRKAVLAIRGTPLDSDCACLPNSPECEKIQSALYFRNPCFEVARLTMLPKFTTKRPTPSTSTTTTSTTTPRTTPSSSATRTTTSRPTTTSTPRRRRPTPSRTSTSTSSTTTTSTTALIPIGPPDETGEVGGSESMPPDSTSAPSPLRTPRPRVTSTTTRRSRITTTSKRPKVTRPPSPPPPIRFPTSETDEEIDESSDDYPEETTTTAVKTTRTTTEATTTEETTTTTTTTTTPAPTTPPTPQCKAIDQETRPLLMNMGQPPHRVYRDRFTRCSSVCRCFEPQASTVAVSAYPDEYQRYEDRRRRRNIDDYEDGGDYDSRSTPAPWVIDPVLGCEEIDCMDDIACPGGTWLGYGAPAFRMNQDKCTCISGEFVCRRLPQGEIPDEVATDEGLFLSIGYSQKEVYWLLDRVPPAYRAIGLDGDNFPHSNDEFLTEMRQELERRMRNLSSDPELPCILEKRMHIGNNFIFEVRRQRIYSRPKVYVDTEEDEEEEYSDEVCRLPVKRLAKALDEDRYRNDIILSVVKEAIVDDRLPYNGCVAYFNDNHPNLMQFVFLYFTSAAVIRWRLFVAAA